jgi:hypothetical protein
MDNLISYLSFAALILVIILLVWSLILTHREKAKKVTARSRLSRLKSKVDALPERSDEDRQKKDQLFRELILEYLDSILGEVERVKGTGEGKKTEKARGKKKKK